MSKLKLVLMIMLTNGIINAQSIKPISGEFKFYKVPELNVVSEQEIGETIFSDVYEESNKSIYLKKEIEITWNLTRFNLKQGYYPLTGENNKFYFYSIEDGLTKKGFAENKKTGEINLFVHSSGILLTKNYKNIDYEKKDYVNNDQCRTCFRKEFIFNGKSDNSLKFIYREYADSMQRPAFTQDLQYDLKDGNVIGFKGLRIEVIEVNNMTIKYKILKHFD